MKRSLKILQRNTDASLRMAFKSGPQKQEIFEVLDCLTPRETGLPLVRIGGANDGGYLVPDDLDGLAACFSPGVSTEFQFDLEMMNRGIPCFMADASVENPVADVELARFDKLFLGPETRGEFISLDDWVSKYAPPEGDLILQMDIEGAEYGVFNAASLETLSRFRIILLELHGLHRVTRRKHLETFAPALKKLNDLFVTVHLHPNNVAPPVSFAGRSVPPFLEAALIRRDRVTPGAVKTQLRHPLDEPNAENVPDYPMPVFWTCT